MAPNEATPRGSGHQGQTGVTGTPIGNPATQSPGVDQAAVAVHNDGPSVTSHFYDIIVNPNYSIGPAFLFRECYEFLSKYT